MVAYLLNFHENIRFSKTLGQNQEQPYPLEKNVFLDPPKKNSCNICKLFMKKSGNIPIFNILQTFFSEYSPKFHWELLPNILEISHGNFLQIFHKHMFTQWVIVLLLNINKK